MENYNEKETKEVEQKRVTAVILIILVIFVLANAYHTKQEERQHAQQQVVSVEQQEKIWEEMVYKSAEEKKLPAAWTVNAYREAKSFYEKCKHEGISREELKRHLINELYTEEVANFVTFYVREADFKEQALTLAKWAQSKEPDRYSAQHPENENDLRLLLTLAYFTDEEIDYAVTKFYNK